MQLVHKDILNEVKASIYGIAETIKEDNNVFYKTLINNWNVIERLFLDFDNNYSWPMSKDNFLSKFDLNKNTVNGQMGRLTRRGVLKEGEDEDYVIEGPGGRMTTTYINEKGAKKLLEKAQSIEGAKYLRKFGINKHLTKCFLYINLIKYAVKGFDNPKKEYTISNPDFRIDLYLEQSKLAVECDELGHEHETPRERYNREEAIKNKLECRFLRFNPHDGVFNIGCFIEVVFCCIFKKNINGEDPIEYWNKLSGNRREISILTKEELAEYD